MGIYEEIFTDRCLDILLRRYRLNELCNVPIFDIEETILYTKS